MIAESNELDEALMLSPKQDQVGAQIAAGKKVILLEGPMGTSKTYACAVACLTVCMQWPGSIGFACRKNMPEIRVGTLPDFRKAAYDMGLIEGYHYVENKSMMYFEFLREAKGSFIYFKELNHTVDPQFFKLKGANLTFGFIDEADGVVREAFNMLNARVGRANSNGAPDFVLMACNANEGWLKTDYYDKYHYPEKFGTLPADTCVVEFELEDSFLDDGYYVKQMRNPKQWVQRYIFNNWSFGDDMYSLFKYRHMDSIHVKTFTRSGRKVLAVDAARVKDRTAGAQWDGNVLADIVVFKDTNIEMDYDEQALLIKAYCEREGIGWQDIWVDAIGEGQGLIVAFKTMFGWVVNSYKSNGVTESKLKLQADLSRAVDEHQRRQIRARNPVIYGDLRSEQTHLLSYDIEHSEVQFYDGCPHLAEFKKEATMHNEEPGTTLKLESKDKVKARTGKSPDIFDCVVMGYYAVQRAKAVGTYAGRNPERSKVKIERRIKTGTKPLTRNWRGTKF